MMFSKFNRLSTAKLWCLPFSLEFHKGYEYGFVKLFPALKIIPNLANTKAPSTTQSALRSSKHSYIFTMCGCSNLEAIHSVEEESWLIPRWFYQTWMNMQSPLLMLSWYCMYPKIPTIWKLCQVLLILSGRRQCYQLPNIPTAQREPQLFTSLGFFFHFIWQTKGNPKDYNYIHWFWSILPFTDQ